MEVSAIESNYCTTCYDKKRSRMEHHIILIRKGYIQVASVNQVLVLTLRDLAKNKLQTH